MGDKVLNMIFKATDKASPTIKDLTGAKGQTGIGGLAASIKGMITPATAAAAGVTALAIGVKGLMEDWQDHVLGIADFNAMIGGTIEETSVIIELSKDYGVTMDTMLASMRMLASQGIEPNIEGLISVRAMLDETTNAADRLKLAQELLGEQGIKQILPMLDELTNEQLRNYVETMTESEQVTLDMVEAAREQREAIKTMGDEWANLKMSVAGWAAPGVTAFIELLTTPFGPDSAAAFINKFFGLQDEVRASLGRSTEGIGENVRAYGRLHDAILDASGATEELTSAQYYLLAAESFQKEGGIEAALGYWALAEGAAAAKGEIDALIATMKLMGGLQMTTGGSPMWAEIPSYDLPDVSAYTAPSSPSPPVDYSTHWSANIPGYQGGGKFKIGGAGGPDSQLVSFMGTPGEEVSVGDDNISFEILAEIRRLVNSIPTAVRDAVERVL